MEAALEELGVHVVDPAAEAEARRKYRQTLIREEAEAHLIKMMKDFYSLKKKEKEARQEHATAEASGDSLGPMLAVFKYSEPAVVLEEEIQEEVDRLGITDDWPGLQKVAAFKNDISV